MLQSWPLYLAFKGQSIVIEEVLVKYVFSNFFYDIIETSTR